MDNKGFIARAKQLFTYFVSKAFASGLQTEVKGVTEGEDSLKKSVKVLIDAVRGVEQDKIPYFTPNEGIKKQVAGLEADAQQGCSEAQHRLGVLYLTGVGVLSDFDKSKSYLEQSAKSGNSESVYWLAGMHLDGFGTEQNINKGLELLGVACSMGSAGAMTRYANIYKDGLFGVERDLRAAERYLSRAVEIYNCPLKSVDLEILREQMEQEGISRDIYAAQSGNAFDSFFESDGYADSGDAGLQTREIEQNKELGYIKL